MMRMPPVGMTAGYPIRFATIQRGKRSAAFRRSGAGGPSSSRGRRDIRSPRTQRRRGAAARGSAVSSSASGIAPLGAQSSISRATTMPMGIPRPITPFRNRYRPRPRVRASPTLPCCESASILRGAPPAPEWRVAGGDVIMPLHHELRRVPRRLLVPLPGGTGRDLPLPEPLLQRERGPPRHPAGAGAGGPPAGRNAGAALVGTAGRPDRLANPDAGDVGGRNRRRIPAPAPGEELPRSWSPRWPSPPSSRVRQCRWASR